MIEALLPERFVDRPVPAIVARVPVGEGRPFLNFGDAGTGGLQSANFYLTRAGYSSFEIVHVQKPLAAQNAPYAALMEQVKEGFGRTLSHLPEVFGVSRQTLYNWLAGETPKEMHQSRLRELAAAAGVFKELGFKPTSGALDRTVSQGKSLLQLIGSGSDGAVAARELVRIVEKGARSRASIDAMLGERAPSRLEASDMGLPAVDETT